MTALNVQNLSFETVGRTLFSDLSFDVSPGEAVHLCGSNGAGKTTLLRILCGTLPPLSGSVNWHGHNISDCRYDYQAQLDYVGHKDGCKAALTAVESLSYARPGTSCETVNAALERVGLMQQAHVLVERLSAGQRRRLALARLLLAPSKNRLWILDEPFTCLDPKGIETVTDIINEHIKNQGLVVMTSHQTFALTHSAVRNVQLGQVL